MTTELSKNLVCVVMRNGIELWIEGDRAARLQAVLQAITGSKFVEFEGQTINTADVLGVFTAPTMVDYRRRKNGEWQCHRAIWHQRGQKCECIDPTEAARKKQGDEEFFNRHGYYRQNN